MIKVVICGSYHRDSEGLARIFRELESHGCRILSPISLNFTNPAEAVLKTSAEQALSTRELELFHLRTIHEADFIWLHDPLGYVGTSGSFELGYASALGKPIFCKEKPLDEMLQTRISVVNSIFDVLEQITK